MRYRVNMSKDYNFSQCKNANSGYLEVTTRKVSVEFYLNITRLVSDSRTVIVRYKVTRFSVSNFKHVHARLQYVEVVFRYDMNDNSMYNFK